MAQKKQLNGVLRVEELLLYDIKASADARLIFYSRMSVNHYGLSLGSQCIISEAYTLII